MAIKGAISSYQDFSTTETNHCNNIGQGITHFKDIISYQSEVLIFLCFNFFNNGTKQKPIIFLLWLSEK